MRPSSAGSFAGGGGVQATTRSAAFDALLAPAPLRDLRCRLEARLGELDRRATLAHGEQLEYAALVRARGDAHAVPNGIARAKDVLRDPSRFFDPDAYASAVATIEA